MNRKDFEALDDLPVREVHIDPWAGCKASVYVRTLTAEDMEVKLPALQASSDGSENGDGKKSQGDLAICAAFLLCDDGGQRMYPADPDHPDYEQGVRTLAGKNPHMLNHIVDEGYQHNGIGQKAETETVKNSEPSQD